ARIASVIRGGSSSAIAFSEGGFVRSKRYANRPGPATTREHGWKDATGAERPARLQGKIGGFSRQYPEPPRRDRGSPNARHKGASLKSGDRASARARGGSH